MGSARLHYYCWNPFLLLGASFLAWTDMHNVSRQPAKVMNLELLGEKTTLTKSLGEEVSHIRNISRDSNTTPISLEELWTRKLTTGSPKTP